MRARLDPDGDLLLSDLPLVLIDTVRMIPELLVADDPAIRERLHPQTYESDEDQEHWRRYVTPDLEHLFASRAEIVQKDLRTLELDDDGEFSMRVPGRHRSAWQSALTGAAHAVYARAGLTPKDMEREPGALGNPERDIALLRVMVLNALLWLMLDVEGHRDPSRKDIEGWEPGFEGPEA